MSHPQRRAKMSLEKALDEERREILELLESRKPPRPFQKKRHASPTPVVRSMLDISSDAPSPRHGSIAGIGVGVTPSSGRGTPVRNLLEPSSPSPLRTTRSATTSPTSPDPPSSESGLSHRRSSDGTDHIPDPRRKLEDNPGVDINKDYKFEMLPSIPNQALPKRASQGGKKAPNSNATHYQSSMAAVMSGADLRGLPGFTRGTETGRPNSSVGIPGHSTSSPPVRMDRSLSPGDRMPNISSLNLASSTGKLVTDKGKLIDMDNAYKRLSNAALARSGGSLSSLARASGESLAEDGDVRLEKDYYDGGDNGSEVMDTSEEEIDDTSSGEDDLGTHRGRRRSRKKRSDSTTASEQSEEDRHDAAKETTQPQSLLAAAEEERRKVDSSYKVKSLLEPEPSKPSKAGMSGSEKPAQKKGGVYPHTSFDYSASTANTPYGSDDEADLSDIKQAQNLSMHMSPIDKSVPNRAIRTIIRGDFARMQQEADGGRRRQRKYLVATDLSDESVYALEWTIGTILRDGDTLFAVYAVDEETGTGKDTDLSIPVQIGEGAKAIQDAAAIVGSQTEKTAISAATTFLPHMLASRLGTGGTDSRSSSVDPRVMSKAELERLHAVEKISQTCIKLLRKTMLQVRVAVEVIHCKSPKHMITEAIDGLEPTLVVLGSRGRSALKGVLLGSFSNYLVAKSSVPVMVARKKLKKHAKFKSSNIRLSNNLTTPKKLAMAKID